MSGRQREPPLDDADLAGLERRGDGREVDPRLGSLVGEAAGQQAGTLLAHLPALPGTEGAPGPTYHGLPVLKEPVWIWSVPVYFHVGGVAGTSALLGAVAELAGAGRLEGLARHCHWLSGGGDALSAALLVHDLGRPARFLNMMRIVRPTSPMSIGSWVLAGCGAASGATVVLQGQDGPLLGRVRRLASVSSALMGLPLAGYTAVLLGTSAVPLWQASRRTLPLLFMASGVAGSAALLALMPHGARERRAVRTWGAAGLAGSLLGTLAVEAEVTRGSARVARPLRRGASGALWRAAQACTAGALALWLLPSTRRRPGWRTLAASALATAGGLAMRFALFHGGKASTRDPHATFQGQP